MEWLKTTSEAPKNNPDQKKIEERIWSKLLKGERWLKYFLFLPKFSIISGSWTDVNPLNHFFTLHSDMLAVLSCFSFNKYAISGKLDQTSLFL